MRFRIGVQALLLVLLTSKAWAAQPQGVPGDHQIRIRIERWLAGHQLPGIAVKVHRGEVSLEGNVLNAFARRRACEHARAIGGVTAVACDLTVASSDSDAAIAAEVGRRVRDYAFYTIYENVEVTAQGGRVTLTGQVMADASVGTMAHIAARVNGATEVINMIRTLPVSPQDDAIRHEIGRLFYENPIFASDAYETRVPIRIIVEHGRVMLTGAVASAAARQEAETIARAVGGVIEVDNRLAARSDGAAVGVSSSKPGY